MGKDTERRTLVATINAKIDELKVRLVRIPDEIEQLENARRDILAKSVKKSKELHEAGQMKASKDVTDTALLDLRGISRSIDDKHKEQNSIVAEIAKLEAERVKLSL